MEGEMCVFIITAKIPRRKLAIGVAAAALLCCCTVALNVEPPPVQEAAAAAAPDPKGVSSNEKRVAYLNAFGWEVLEEPIATQEMLIPEELDDSYQEYLALQNQQGFDLTQYAGKRAKRYTYEVTNYPTGETGVQANLLIYKNRVIGGEVLSPTMNGFLHGLNGP